ncbi:MAG TPA: ABC transporter permease [Actinomycetota bacterium]|nr:ABC transporter permease [Actinomycetota bacterium]
MSVTTPLTPAELQPRQAGRLYWAIEDARVLAWRHLVQIPRIPELLVFATVQPVMLVILFRYVFGGSIDVGRVSYVNYLMAGIFVQTVAFGSVATGIGLADDLTKGLIDRFRSLPMSRSAVLTGRTIADLVRNMFVVVVMLLVGLLVGFRPDAGVLDWARAIGLLLLLSFAFSWVGASVGLLVRSVEAAQSGGFIWLFPLTFASSAFVQPEKMSGWLRPFAENQPFSVIVDVVRGYFLDQPVGSKGWIALAWVIGLVVVFAPLSVRLYEKRTAS